jgi:hypothetical protein
MPLLTLFSAPKPFTDPHIATIQCNAVRSWMLLPEVQVLVLGEEPGLAEAARELGVRHVPQVERNASGTPLISSMFRLARQHSDGELLCIVNADMILMPDFAAAARRVLQQREMFILLSQRWDVDITAPLDFGAGWERRLESDVRARGRLHRPAGSDFFVFPRAAYTDVPDFAIGRAGWDNWMIYAARRARWPVVDCTPAVMIVHQNHDYSHLSGTETHHTAPETDANIELAGGQAAIRYTVVDATAQLTADGRLRRPPLSYLRFMRAVELSLRALFFFLPEDLLEEVARPKRWKKRIRKLLGMQPGDQ